MTAHPPASPPDPFAEAIAAMEEFGRIKEGVARDAEAELKARGIERDDRIPVLDQLAETEGLWHSDVLFGTPDRCDCGLVEAVQRAKQVIGQCPSCDHPRVQHTRNGVCHGADDEEPLGVGCSCVRFPDSPPERIAP